MAEPVRKTKIVKLGKTFTDAVVIAGATRVEISAAGDVHVSRNAPNEQDNNAPGGAPERNARDRILILAADKARELRHPMITFDHLLLAVSQDNPLALTAVLPRELSVPTLQKMIESNLRDQAGLPPPPDIVNPVLGREAAAALRRTEAATRRYRSDSLFGIELLHAMLSAGNVDQSERSIVLNYIGLLISNHYQHNAAAVLRKDLDRLALSINEAPAQNPGAPARRPEGPAV